MSCEPHGSLKGMQRNPLHMPLRMSEGGAISLKLRIEMPFHHAFLHRDCFVDIRWCLTLFLRYLLQKLCNQKEKIPSVVVIMSPGLISQYPILCNKWGQVAC